MANTSSVTFELSNSEHAYVADNAALSLSTDFTLESWFKPQTLASTSGLDNYLMAKYRTGDANRSYALIWNTADDTLNLNVSDDGTAAVTFKSTSTLSAGSWQHVAAVFDIGAETCNFYFDLNVEAGAKTGTIGATIYDGAADFTLAARDNGTQSGSFFYDGQMDEARVWSDKRTLGELTANWKQQLTGTADNLVASYQFTDDLTDSGGTNNLTGVNTPTFSSDVPFVGTIAVPGSTFGFFMH